MPMQFTNLSIDVVRGYGALSYGHDGFMDMFPDEVACLEHLSLVRWPDGYVCQPLRLSGCVEDEQQFVPLPGLPLCVIYQQQLFSGVRISVLRYM